MTDLKNVMESKTVVKAEIVGVQDGATLRCKCFDQVGVIPKELHGIESLGDFLVGMTLDVIINSTEPELILDHLTARDMKLATLSESLTSSDVLFNNAIDEAAQDKVNIFDEYRRDMASKEIILGEVVKVDHKGNLELVLEKTINGQVYKAKGFMLNKNIDGKELKPRYRSNLIGKDIKILCTVIDVNETAGYIELESDYATRSVSEYEKRRLIKKIDEIKKSDEYKESRKNPYLNIKLDWPVVKARVLFVARDGKRVTLDINNLRLLCHVRIDNWSWGRIYFPQSEIKEGQTVKLAITDYKPENKKLNKGFMFWGSRKDAYENPWDTLDQRYAPGNVIKVRCMDRKQDKFFGKYEGEEIEVMVYFNGKDSTLNFDDCRVGKDYIVQISTVDKSRKRLIAHYESEA